MSVIAAPVRVLILAGRRPGTDPLLAAYPGIATKALIPVGGRPMLAHVIDAVGGLPGVRGIAVAAQDHALIAACPAIAGLAAVREGRVSFVPSRPSIADTVADHARAAAAEALPLIITTADHVLLTPMMVQAFSAGAAGAEVAAGLVERRVLEAAHPGNRRTWLRFRGGSWSGANLFRLEGPNTAAVTDLWRRIETDRKKGRAIIAAAARAAGPLLLVGTALRLMTIQQAVARAGRRLGVDARAVPMPDAEACIDADTPADIALIEAILARRAA